MSDGAPYRAAEPVPEDARAPTLAERLGALRSSHEPGGLVGLFHRGGTRVDLHEGGVVVARSGGEDVAIFDDVDEVWFEIDEIGPLGAKVARIRAVRLREFAGAEHIVPLLVQGAPAALRWVVRRCSDPLARDAEAAIDTGETLTFASVVFDREDLSIRGATAPWSSVCLVRFQASRVHFFRGQTVLPWRSVSLEEVPHPTLFARLVSARAVKVERDDGWLSLFA